MRTGLQPARAWFNDPGPTWPGRLVREAPSFTFQTFAIAFGLDGGTGLLKGPLELGNCENLVNTLSFAKVYLYYM